MKLVRKTTTSARFVIKITETDPLSLGEFGGGGEIRKN